MLHTVGAVPVVILVRSAAPRTRPAAVRWLSPAPRETVPAERRPLAPGVWIVRYGRWLTPRELDTAAELPDDPVEAARPRRARRLDAPAWHGRALCARMPQDLADAVFFGEDGRLPPAMRIIATDAARRICAACPVARQCLTAALLGADHYLPDVDGAEGRTVRRYGVWGGTSGRQRTAMAVRIADGERLADVVDEFLEAR